MMGAPAGMPMDPSMAAGAMPQGAPPMDPSMMGAPAGMPVDPAMMGGMPHQGAPPMDPSMMGAPAGGGEWMQDQEFLQFLQTVGFQFAPDGSILDPNGQPVDPAMLDQLYA